MDVSYNFLFENLQGKCSDQDRDSGCVQARAIEMHLDKFQQPFDARINKSKSKQQSRDRLYASLRNRIA